MASVGKDRPNLKICIDNTEDQSESEESSEGSEVDAVSEKDEDETEIQIHVSSEEEEGEITLTVDEVSGTRFQDNQKRYENKAGNFVTGVDITSEESQAKREQRAKRFGIQTETKHACSAADMKKLFKSLGLSETQMKRDERGIRMEAIHVRGVNNMSTKEVFQVFKEFAPGNIEWIDDSSCNAVWFDKTTAARAMLSLSHDPYDSDSESDSESGEESKTEKAQHKDNDHKMDTEDNNDKSKKAEKVEKKMDKCEDDEDDLNLLSDDEEDKKESTKESKMEEEQNSDTDKTDDEKSDDENESEKSDREGEEKRSEKEEQEEGEVMDSGDEQEEKGKPNKKHKRRKYDHLDDLPPGKWRVCNIKHKASMLYFRFSTKADKKLPGAEKKSRYYQQFGNPNYGGMKGVISESRKRKYRSDRYRHDQEEAHEAVLQHKRQPVQMDEPEVVPEIEEWGVGVDTTTSVTPTYNILSRVATHMDTQDPIGDEDYFTSYRDRDLRSRQRSYHERDSYKRHVSERHNIQSSTYEESPVDSTKDSACDSDENLEEELGQLLKETPPKRKMRMYADDVEEEATAKRSAIAAAKDARNRITSRKRQRFQEEEERQEEGEEEEEEELPWTMGDLRSRIKNRKDAGSLMKRIKVQVDAW